LASGVPATVELVISGAVPHEDAAFHNVSLSTVGRVIIFWSFIIMIYNTLRVLLQLLVTSGWGTKLPTAITIYTSK